MSAEFFEDLYLYDLNAPCTAPLARRCASGGEPAPDLPTLLGLSVREWASHEQTLYQEPICVAGDRCAIILPLCGNIGRFAVVMVPHLSHGAFARLVNSGALGDFAPISVAGKDKSTPEAEQSFAIAVRRMHLLTVMCAQIRDAVDLEECIGLACEQWGITRMPRERAEFAPLQTSGVLEDAALAPCALTVSLLCMVSLIRNEAHARSGWLYATDSENGPVLQCAFRADAGMPLQVLDRLQQRLEDGGVTVGRRDRPEPRKPPKQYAYMHRKIGDPTRPLCNLCGRYDQSCDDCVAVRWAVLPFVTDRALLGIKNYIKFEY